MYTNGSLVIAINSISVKLSPRYDHIKVINRPHIKSNFAEHTHTLTEQRTQIHEHTDSSTNTKQSIIIPKLNSLQQYEIYKHYETYKIKIFNDQIT